MKEHCKQANQNIYPFILPDLPFSDNALEPHMSAKTFSFHHKKHHNAYVVNLNNLLENSDMKNSSLEEIIFNSANDASKLGIFNNAAQIWNHSFFWHCMKPNAGGLPTGEISRLIDRDFGSFENFVTQFKIAATTQFGSGWAWLALDEDSKLIVIKTSNADLPMVHGKKALLTIDVWEHAYYLDFQNLRANYFDIFIKNLVNWDFVNEMLK